MFAESMNCWTCGPLMQSSIDAAANGFITKELAAVAEQVVGVDFSEPMLDIAMQDHRPENASYQLADVLDLARIRLQNSRKFDKVLMYGALHQCFLPFNYPSIPWAPVPGGVCSGKSRV